MACWPTSALTMWHGLWLVGAKAFRSYLYDLAVDNVASIYVSQNFLRELVARSGRRARLWRHCVKCPGNEDQLRQKAYRPASSSNSDALAPRVEATRIKFRSEMFFSPRSSTPMYVRCSPDSNPKSSCDQPRTFLRLRITRPSACSGVGRCSVVTRRVNRHALFESTL